MLSALVFMTLLPLNASVSDRPQLLLDRPLSVSAFVDTAKILGLPKLKLRDSNGHRYFPERILMQEPMAIIEVSSGGMYFSQLSVRKAYIQSYMKR
jgi:hypothetical protein